MTAPTSNAVLCRYGEIALKGGNRGMFEQTLVNCLKRSLQGIEDLRHVRERGRIVLHRKGHSPFTAEHVDLIASGLERVFGLESYSLGCIVDSTLAAIEKNIADSFPQQYQDILDAGADHVTYRMRARRSNKMFPMRSQKLEIYFADKLLPAYDKLKLNLNDDAAISIGVEVREQWTFVSYGQTSGPGGLPVGCSSPALVLLSGGIDSPVAAYQIMKRGCHTNFLTFHSHPYTPPETIDKVWRIATVLNNFQKSGILLACNLVEAQKIIRDSCEERYRTILYRRLMMRIATVLAEELGDRTLITGESLAQVASQTVPNLEVIDRATEMLILRPVISHDKTEITALARRIGTFDISEFQCADSCTVFSPRSPATGATVSAIRKQEGRMDLAELLEVSLASVTVVRMNSGESAPFIFRTREAE
jgi:thiamine biosynthesis protein ThiI